jgi:WD40 repeat protein
VISVSEVGKAQLWNAETGEELFAFNDTGVTSAHFSPDGSSVVTASLNRTVRVWDARTGRQTRQLLGHSGDVNGARFSSDGKKIVSASGDHTVRVWDPETENQTVRYAVGGDAFDAAFTADGKIIVALYDGNLEVFDASWTMEEGRTLARRVCDEKLMNAERFTPDDGLDQSLLRFVGTNPCHRTGLLLPIFGIFPVSG